MHSDDASDVTMQTAVSNIQSSTRPLSRATQAAMLEPPNPLLDRAASPMIVDEPVVSEPSLDLMHRIPGLYRLLDLVQERGSGGVGT